MVKYKVLGTSAQTKNKVFADTDSALEALRVFDIVNKQFNGAVVVNNDGLIISKRELILLSENEL